MIDVEKFIEMKGLEYGLPSLEDLTVTQLVKHIGSEKRYEQSNLKKSLLTGVSFIPKQSDIAFNVHPICVNLSDHSHDFVEINYIYQGGCTQVLNNEEEIELTEGDILILEKGTTHSVRLNHGTQDLIINCMISQRYFDKKLLLRDSSNRLVNELGALEGNNYPTKGYYLFSGEKSNNLRFYFENCISEFFDSKVCSESVIDAYVTLLFSDLCRIKYVKGLPNDSRYDLALEVVSFIRNHQKTVTLESAAKAFHFSSSYLSKLLKKQLNKTFVEIVHEIRLNQAYLLIINTDKTIEEISENVGYSNTYYFTKIFSSRYGCLPSSIRKR